MSKVELGKIPFKHSKLEKNGTASNTVEKNPLIALVLTRAQPIM